MMNEQVFCIEVKNRDDEVVPHALMHVIQQAGIGDIDRCLLERLYFLQGDLSLNEVEHLAQTLLTDVVTETFTVAMIPHSGAVFSSNFDPRGQGVDQPDHTIDVTLLPGVTDPVAENLVRAAHILGLTALERAATGQRYAVWGNLTELHRLAVEVFSNPVIQRYTIDCPITPPFVPVQHIDSTVETILLCEADDITLQAISKNRRLALDLNEMRAIQAYFRQESRDPTDAELETLAQTWSEHCVHKTFRAIISHTSEEKQETINGLLRSYIRAATERIAKPWVRSAFVDNAGIIAFDDQWDIAFKVETHNHPSALEPFGGANTGVGGVVRDVLGVSARPIANTDVLCFGPPDLLEAEIPTGVLHPRRVAAGVVHGVEDYGNKMGIPTVNGAIFYHHGYTANPLVFCGCLGLLPHGCHPTTPQPGDLIIVIGGRTGRDGLRGATFSSMEMDQTTSEIAGSAVQIGHPIHEKQVLEVVLRARDEQLYHAITDCGAGGLASAIGEMGQHIGAHVRLEAVPLKYPGLRPWEIWLSEAQERMVFAVAPEHWPRLRAISDGQDIEAVCVGEFTSTGRLQLFYEDTFVGDLAMDFLHGGIPQRYLEAQSRQAQSAEQASARRKVQSAEHKAQNAEQILLALLAHPNIRSKESVVRRYDHEVQGATLVKPLVGVDCHGPGDATVLVPLETIHHNQGDLSSTSQRGIALSAGICPSYGELDPYAMAWAAIDEAMRNIVAVGTDPDQVALLDNFCWGNPNLPDRLGSLVRCVQGCYDAAIAYNAPFISGKDSLNNEYTGADGRKHAIPGTLLISACGIVPNVQRTITMDLKQDGNALYIIGETRAELGGSHYEIVRNIVTNTPCPQPIDAPLQRLQTLHQAIVSGLVQSCHDCSEGGLAVALAEMCLAGRKGAEIHLGAVPCSPDVDCEHVVLFSESLCRFLVEVRFEDQEAFDTLFADHPHACVGYVRNQQEPMLTIHSCNNDNVVHITIANLESAWRFGKVEAQSEQAQSAERKTQSVERKAQSEQAQSYAPAILTHQPKVLILHANGTNRDREAAIACRLAGGDPEIVHINQLLERTRTLLDYHMLLFPGGFSYGDDLGAGTLWALDVHYRLHSDIESFVASGRPVLGICNGFQALVKSGLLPGLTTWPDHQVHSTHQRVVTLAPNELGHFECRWVYLHPSLESSCLFTQGLDNLIYCPVAHGEGRLMTRDEETLKRLHDHHLIALTYVDAHGNVAGYPANPNGSVMAIAGICNEAGNVLGMMPHPEDHIFAWQHPRHHRGERGMSGLGLFQNGIKAC